MTSVNTRLWLDEVYDSVVATMGEGFAIGFVSILFFVLAIILFISTLLKQRKDKLFKPRNGYLCAAACLCIGLLWSFLFVITL